MSKFPKYYDTKNIYFCKGLIKDPLTNSTLVTKSTTVIYYLKHKKNQITLNLNAMDYIAEYSANILLAHYNAQEAQTNKNEYKLKIEENNHIISSKEKQINEHEKAIERAIEVNIIQPKYFPTEKLNAIIKQNETVISKLKTEIIDLQIENTRMENWLNGKRQQFINTIKGLSDAKKKELIDSVIEKIEAIKIGVHHYKIIIHNKIGLIQNEWFEYISKNNKIHVEQVFADGRNFDLTPQIIKNKRFTRKRYNNK